MVTLVWSAGDTPRKSPAVLAPTAGATLEVRARHTRGLRLRKGFASSERKLARSRVKKRNRSRWKSRIDESDKDRRKFGDRQIADLRFGLGMSTKAAQIFD